MPPKELRGSCWASRPHTEMWGHPLAGRSCLFSSFEVNCSVWAVYLAFDLSCVSLCLQGKCIHCLWLVYSGGLEVKAGGGWGWWEGSNFWRKGKKLKFQGGDVKQVRIQMHKNENKSWWFMKMALKNQDSIQNVIYKRSKMREPLFSTQNTNTWYISSIIADKIIKRTFKLL